MKQSCILLIILLLGCNAQEKAEIESTSQYVDLVALFKEWRSFEAPPLLDGAPDYTAKGFEERRSGFKELQNRLLAIDTTGWDIDQQVDWRLVEAEMKGYYFNDSILDGTERCTRT